MSDDCTLDFETKSTVDLRKTGVHVYAEDKTTDVWCCAYAFGDHDIKVWKPGDPCPPEIIAHVKAGGIFRAFNAAFERAVWAAIMTPRHGWPAVPLRQWRCTMAAGMAMSLPASLKNMGAALGLDTGKVDEEHRQMLQMASPRRPRKGELPGGVYWWDDEERKQRLYKICANDVRSERDVQKRILALRGSEQELWFLDQIINDRGVHVDVELCNAALKVVATAEQWLNDELKELTDGVASRTTNVNDISRWLAAEGFPMASLDKEHIDDALVCRDLPPSVRRVLEIRREGAKAAVKKIDALLNGRSADGQARGLLQFHAAGTGRWAGRRFQPQNIKRPQLKRVDDAIDAVRTGDADYVRLLYGEPLAVVGDCLRGMVAAAPGKKLLAADFSNIEGRIIAWLAGEDWKLRAFRDFDAGIGPDIYKLAYARAFGISPNDVDDLQRQVGKVMELALGFQGGVVAFQKMAAIYKVEVEDERADVLKNMWRETHPNVVAYWYDLERAAKNAIENRGKIFSAGRIAFRTAGSFLFMRLPSGRSICYPYPCIKDKMTPWGEMRPQVSYKGVDTYTRKWGDCFAHGGLLFNNAVQGTARDVEAEAMVRLQAAEYETGDPNDDGIILTVHDEVLCEVDQDFGTLTEFEAIMATPPAWGADIPIAVSGFEAQRYRK